MRRARGVGCADIRVDVGGRDVRCADIRVDGGGCRVLGGLTVESRASYMAAGAMRKRAALSLTGTPHFKTSKMKFDNSYWEDISRNNKTFLNSNEQETFEDDELL